VQVLTDEMRVRQIVMNGLTNAVKYSNAPENGPIQVVMRTYAPGARSGGRGPGEAAATTGYVAVAVQQASTQPLLLCVEVLDHGPGLRGLHESVLFTDFGAPTSEVTAHAGHGRYSGTNRTVRVGSSGVGLPICKRWVHAPQDAATGSSCVVYI
jgi:signal transduction histidine kinase